MSAGEGQRVLSFLENAGADELRDVQSEFSFASVTVRVRQRDESQRLTDTVYELLTGLFRYVRQVTTLVGSFSVRR